MNGIRTATLLTLVVASFVPASEVSGQAAAGQSLVRIDSVAVRGNRLIEPTEVVGVTGVQPGSQNSWVDIQRAIKALWATGLYADVQVKLATTAGRNTLLIDVVERSIVQEVRVTGLERISESAVLEESELRSGDPLSRNSLERAKTFIREELRRQGVPFAAIEESVTEVDGLPGYVDVVLSVDEGQRVTVAQVDFLGNMAFSDEDLHGALSTKPEGFFWFRAGNFDDIVFELDLLENLPRHYRRSGYLDFQVLGDSLVVDPTTGKARIEIRIDEGLQYHLGEFSIEGNDAFDTGALEDLYLVTEGGLLASFGFSEDAGRAGQVFDLESFEGAAQQANEQYSNEGYLFATVEPYWQKAGNAEDGTPLVDAGWRIDERRQAYVNRVIIEGNDFTYDRVIREKIFVLPGDVYSQARLLSSYQNIQSLGFFESPMSPPDIRPTPDGDVDIVFRVDEKQTGAVNFGTSLGGGVGLSGFLGYDQPNLFGQAKAGNIRWDFGRFINSFSMGISDPALFQSTVSGNFQLFNSTDRFFQFATGRRRRTGFNSRFGIPFPGSLRTRIFMGYSLSRTSYRLFSSASDNSLFGLPPGTLSALSIGVTRRTLNHPLFPTEGSMQTWNADFNGGILGGSANFVKHTAEAAWVVPVGSVGGTGGGPGGIQFALAVSLKGGALFGDASRFPFESFWMGGVQFGESLRGYDETSVTPNGYFPERGQGIRQIDRLGNAYLSATAEYKMIVNGQIGVSTFFDAGNLWNGPEDIDGSRMFRGAGFGVQLVTPFGPIGIDYAYGFDKPEPGWQMHFKMGPNF